MNSAQAVGLPSPIRTRRVSRIVFVLYGKTYAYMSMYVYLLIIINLDLIHSLVPFVSHTVDLYPSIGLL